jgi:spermidine/putrescine transport system permease protein
MDTTNPLPKNPEKKNVGLGLAWPPALFLVIFFIAPLFFVVLMSMLSRGDNPADYTTPFTAENYTAIFNEPIFTILVRSVRIALVTTLVCFIMGYPLAFFISTRQNNWVRQLALFLVILPFWTNFLVRTYAWQIILGRRGVLNEFIFWIEEISGLELLDRPLELLGTEFAVLLGLVYSFLPFMVLPIFANVERFNFRLVEAGHDLGGNDWKVFWRVVFPMTLPGVVAGWILVFIPTIGAFVTPALLGGTEGFMIGNYINRQFKDAGGSWVLGAGSSVVMTALVAVALYIYFNYADDDTGGDSTAARDWGNLFFRWIVAPIATFLVIWAATATFFPGQGLLLAAAILAPIVLYLLYGLASDAQQSAAEVKLKQFDATPKPFEVSEWAIRRDLWMRQIGKIGLWFNPVVCFVFLWIPIILLVVFSFNDSRRAGGRWEGFTTNWYNRIFEGVTGTGGSEFSTDQMIASLETTIIVSVTATIFATILGTMASLALVRGKFIGQKALNGLVYLPIVLPEITVGVSLLIFFKIVYDGVEVLTGTRFFPGTPTVIVGHIAFALSYVAIVVSARLTDMNPRLEEAARDLGANEWRTFRRVTFPLLLPGIVAGALLAFTLSLDDFVITFFVGGGTTTTLTVFVWGLVRRGVSPEINAVSTLMIIASTILIFISLLLQGRNSSAAQR